MSNFTATTHYARHNCCSRSRTQVNKVAVLRTRRAILTAKQTIRRYFPVLIRSAQYCRDPTAQRSRCLASEDFSSFYPWSGVNTRILATTRSSRAARSVFRLARTVQVQQETEVARCHTLLRSQDLRTPTPAVRLNARPGGHPRWRAWSAKTANQLAVEDGI